MFIALGKRSLKMNIDQINKWGKENYIGINEKKCAIIRVRGKKTPKDLTLQSISGIQFVEKYKYLGITIDQSLNLKTHLNLITKRAYGLVANFFKFMKDVVSVKLRLELWKIYVRPIVEYGAEIFLLLPTKLSKLNTIYHSSLKSALGLGANTSNLLLRRAVGILDLKDTLSL